MWMCVWMVPWCPIQGVFPFHTRCSWNRLRIHQDSGKTSLRTYLVCLLLECCMPSGLYHMIFTVCDEVVVYEKWTHYWWEEAFYPRCSHGEGQMPWHSVLLANTLEQLACGARLFYHFSVDRTMQSKSQSLYKQSNTYGKRLLCYSKKFSVQ